mgnify:CR=1 FL=1
MTVNEIVAVVENLLASEAGRERTEAVVQYLGRLVALQDDETKPLPGINRRGGMEFFSTTGKLLKPKATLDVRIHGRLVGEVALKENGKRIFRPVKPWKGEWPKSVDVDWADRRVLKFLAARLQDLPKKELEAKVQSALFGAMRQVKGPKKLKELRQNQPVQMLRQPFQFPLPISASGAIPEVAVAPALGHADILARGRGGHRLKVFEIKRPRGDARHALAQGVAYAAALERLLDMAPAVTYRALGYSKARKASPKLEVWAFVHADDVDNVLAGGNALQAANSHFDLHLLPYRFEGGQRLALEEPIAVGKSQRQGRG